MRVLTTVPLDTGLNNQKICLIGLFSLAEAVGARAAYRSTMIDYRPSQRRPVREIPFGDLFDEAAVRRVVDPLWADEPTEPALSMAECFAAGNRALARSGPSDRPARLLAALAPAPALAEVARSIGTWLDQREPWAAVQLRIERDWVAYLRRKQTDRPDAVSVAMTEPARIFDKVRQTFFMRNTRRLYACCDESDLGQSRAELKALAAERGFDLVFKSEMALDLPTSTIGKAIVDFALCRTAPVYIGLDRSTFSNMLLRLSAWDADGRRHYRYNSDHLTLRLRTAPAPIAF